MVSPNCANVSEHSCVQGLSASFRQIPPPGVAAKSRVASFGSTLTLLTLPFPTTEPHPPRALSGPKDCQEFITGSEFVELSAGEKV